MTLRELLRKTEEQLILKEMDSNVAKVLFYHLADKEPHQLYLMMDEEVEPSLIEKFEAGMTRYFQGEPIQYIKGVETFFGRDFIVNPKVLIPRYETEELVENILYRIDDYFKDYSKIKLIDVGTGSGAIAISLALEEARLEVTASDLSAEAIEIAKANGAKLGAKVEFLVGDMLQPFIQRQEKVDIFVSNPPYIPDNQEVEAIVKDNEPNLALFGGNDGLYFYRLIFKDIKQILNSRAILAFEMGFDQRELMEQTVREYFDDDFEIIKDINGKDRMLFIYYGIKNETGNK